MKTKELSNPDDTEPILYPSMLRFSHLYICLITFSLCLSAQAANRYWIASAAANWNSAANWSSTSGGAGGASVPGTSDVVIFDGNGIGNCIIDGSVNIFSVIVHGGYTGTITQGNHIISILSTATFQEEYLLGVLPISQSQARSRYQVAILLRPLQHLNSETTPHIPAGLLHTITEL